MTTSVLPLERLLHIAVDVLGADVSRCVSPPRYDFVSRTSFASDAYDLELIFEKERAHLSLYEKKSDTRMVIWVADKQDGSREDYLLSISLPSPHLARLVQGYYGSDTAAEAAVISKISNEAERVRKMGLFMSPNINYPVDVHIDERKLSDLSAAFLLRYFSPEKKQVHSKKEIISAARV